MHLFEAERECGSVIVDCIACEILKSKTYGAGHVD